MVSRHQPKTNIWRHRQNREPQICKLKWFVKNGQSIWGWPQNSWLWSYTRSISQGYSSTWCYQYECHLGLSSQMSDGNIGKSKIVTAMKPPVTECSISEHTHTPKKSLAKTQKHHRSKWRDRCYHKRCCCTLLCCASGHLHETQLEDGRVAAVEIACKIRRNWNQWKSCGFTIFSHSDVQKSINLPKVPLKTMKRLELLLPPPIYKNQPDCSIEIEVDQWMVGDNHGPFWRMNNSSLQWRSLPGVLPTHA